jgi:hypothetical protein
MGDETRGKITCPHCGEEIALKGSKPPPMDCGFVFFLLLLAIVSAIVVLGLLIAASLKDMQITFLCLWL